MIKTRYFIVIIFSILGIVLSIFSSCRKDESFSTDPSLKLSFSNDSIIFDTVFTTMGSVTQQLRVYNRNNNAVTISKIRLAGGSESPYRINVDGASGVEMNNIEIGGNDSIYIFVKVTVDPQNNNSPMVVKDSVVFETNGNQQDVDLVAWGQDAHFILGVKQQEGLPPYKIIAESGEQAHWVNDKPYVIVGYAVVDSAASLTIDAGCRIHFYNGSGLWIYKYGSIQVNGSLEEPVNFQGVRLEEDYQNIPAQWDRIWINESDVNSEINYAIIKNGTIGIQAETLKSGLGNKLTINNTKILNMQGWGIFTRFYNIEGNNLLIANSGSSTLNLTTGGSYQFKNSTFANFYGFDIRKDPILHLADYYIFYSGSDQIVYSGDLAMANFIDCIFYGNLDNEIFLDRYPENFTVFNYSFDHCLLKTLHTSDANFTSCLFNQDPLFVEYQENNFHLDSLSPVRNLGIPTGFTHDLDGVLRTETPDLGAFQWIPTVVEDRR